MGYGTARCNDYRTLHKLQRPGFHCMAGTWDSESGSQISPLPEFYNRLLQRCFPCNVSTRSCMGPRDSPASPTLHDAPRVHGYFSVPTR